MDQVVEAGGMLGDGSDAWGGRMVDLSEGAYMLKRSLYDGCCNVSCRTLTSKNLCQGAK